jgi:hypothetical protein
MMFAIIREYLIKKFVEIKERGNMRICLDKKLGRTGEFDYQNF